MMRSSNRIFSEPGRCKPAQAAKAPWSINFINIEAGCKFAAKQGGTAETMPPSL